MKRWQSWKRWVILAGAILLVLAGAGLLGQLLPGRRGSDSMGGAFSPAVALAAPLAQLPLTFDSAEAGMSAYLNTGSTIDLTKVTPMLSPIYGRGATNVVGSVGQVYLYADTSGWLVAYIPRGGNSSRMTQWSQVSSLPVSANGLDAALKQAVAALGLNWNTLGPKVGYYHWGYPSATKLVFFSKGILGIPANVSFLVPNTATLYEASWSGFFYSTPTIQLDGVNLSLANVYWVSNPIYAYRVEAAISDLSLGSTHVLRLVPYSSGEYVGVAVALVVK